MTIRIVAGAGIAVGGRKPASEAVEAAMRAQVLEGQEAGDDPEVTKTKLMAARYAAKPWERR